MKFNLSIVKNKKIFFIITAVIVLAGILSMIFRGFYWDVDFAGGTEISYTVADETGLADKLGEIEQAVRDALTELGSDGKKINSVRTVQGGFAVKSTELSDIEVLAVDLAVKEYFNDPVKSPYTMDVLKGAYAEGQEEMEAEDEAETPETPENGETADGATTDGETTDGETTDGENKENETPVTTPETDPAAVEIVKQETVDSVGETVSKELRSTAIISATIAVVLMLVYITIRFQFSSALAAVVCLCHDLFIVLAAYSIFQIPVSSNVIAVLLTILGYSINATIIVFDRVRENVKRMQQGTFEEKVNVSVNQTIMRSINTTITTLLTIGLIYILGVQTIKEFALPLIIGLFAGLYSSICLAGSLWTVFKRKGTRVK